MRGMEDDTAKLKASQDAAYERTQRAYAVMQEALAIANEQEELAKEADPGPVRDARWALAKDARAASDAANREFTDATGEFMRTVDKLRPSGQ